MKRFTKNPADVLPYKFDFAAETNLRSDADGDWLDSGETLSSKVLAAETGITIDSSAFADTNTSVIVWLSGGTFDAQYTIDCACVTSLGKTVKKSIEIVMTR